MVDTLTEKTMSPQRKLLAGLHSQLRNRATELVVYNEGSPKQFSLPRLDHRRMRPITDSVSLSNDGDLVHLVNGQQRYATVGMDLIPLPGRNGHNVFRSDNTGLVLAQDKKSGSIDVHSSLKSFMEFTSERKPVFYGAKLLVGIETPTLEDRTVYAFTPSHAFKLDVYAHKPYAADAIEISNLKFGKGYLTIAKLPYKQQ